MDALSLAMLKARLDGARSNLVTSQVLRSGPLSSHLSFGEKHILCGQEDSKDTPASLPVSVVRGHPA